MLKKLLETKITHFNKLIDPFLQFWSLSWSHQLLKQQKLIINRLKLCKISRAAVSVSINAPNSLRWFMTSILQCFLVVVKIVYISNPPQFPLKIIDHCKKYLTLISKVCFCCLSSVKIKKFLHTLRCLILHFKISLIRQIFIDLSDPAFCARSLLRLVFTSAKIFNLLMNLLSQAIQEDNKTKTNCEKENKFEIWSIFADDDALEFSEMVKKLSLNSPESTYDLRYVMRAFQFVLFRVWNSPNREAKEKKKGRVKRRKCLLIKKCVMDVWWCYTNVKKIMTRSPHKLLSYLILWN